MNPISIDRPSEIASNLVMAAFCLALVAGYFLLFQLFRADRLQSSSAVMEQAAVQPTGESFSHQKSE